MSTNLSCITKKLTTRARAPQVSTSNRNRNEIIMRNLMCFALFLALSVVQSNAQDYCNLPSCQRINRQHTMCIYPSGAFGPLCGDEIRSVGVTQDERDTIVNQHNRLRAYVAAGRETRGSNGPQPPATNMMAMSWDSELERVAQRWANQCDFGHDGCRNVERFAVGQNVGIRSTTGPDRFNSSQVIQDWYDEVRLFDRNQVASLTNITEVGHYTQIVWADTTRVGCSQIRYVEPDRWNAYYLVCNYGPAGNIYGYPVYNTP